MNPWVVHNEPFQPKYNQLQNEFFLFPRYFLGFKLKPCNLFNATSRNVKRDDVASKINMKTYLYINCIRIQ